MQKTLTKKISALHYIDGVRVGMIIDIGQDGSIWVDFADNSTGPLKARFVSTLAATLLEQIAEHGQEVLLAFENNNAALPIIVGSLHASIHECAGAKPLMLELDKPENILMNGTQVDVEAEDQMVLRCGKASIILTRAGKVLIRGTYLSHQSTGVNQIKGSSVKIN
jgi:hypothetical protein